MKNNSFFEKCAKIDLVLILNDEEVINGSSVFITPEYSVIITDGPLAIPEHVKVVEPEFAL